MTDLGDNYLRNNQMTDKSLNGFVPEYSKMAERLGCAAHVLELGVREGDSLRMWQRFFPEGVIVGVDNDAEGKAAWPAGTVQIHMGQDDPKVGTLAVAASPGGYDLIVDDASHVGELTERSFNILWPQVKADGYYVIEDFHLGYQPEWSHWHETGDSMLNLACKVLTMFGAQSDRYPGVEGGEIDEIRYVWGMIIIHKRR